MPEVSKTVVGNTVHVQGAFIESIYKRRNAVAIIISYVEKEKEKVLFVKQMTLIINRNSRIRDQYGQKLKQRDLKEGMRMDAVISKPRTFSSSLYSIVYRMTVAIGNSTSDTVIDRILFVEMEKEFIITGNEKDLSSQIRFNITREIKIIDHRGKRIGWKRLRAGQLVKIKHAKAIVSSIPVQITADSIQIL